VLREIRLPKVSHLSLTHREGAATQVWLAVSEQDDARVTGRYLKRFGTLEANAHASDVCLQEELLGRPADLTGVRLSR
jgi:hypothetical protein